jgi:alpha-mannosidase
MMTGGSQTTPAAAPPGGIEGARDTVEPMPARLAREHPRVRQSVERLAPPPESTPRSRIMLIFGLLLLATNLALIHRPAGAHDVYIMNDNHTDYGWNATTDVYDEAMAAEIDYYLNQIEQFANEPPETQARFSADCWWYLYNYEKKRSPVLFDRLIEAIRSGHITVPLNPFVLLYGAMSTEAAIRAGYYPGRMERKYGIRFRLAANIENQTSPWGLASLWAGSGAEYSWKGVCGCATDTPFRDHVTDVFRWRGPDGQEILKKWYKFDFNGMSFGGYAEARSHLSLDGIRDSIRWSLQRTPGIPVTGVFGGGHDDVAYMTDRFVRTAQQWNRSAWSEDRVIVSNGIDYFEALEEHAERLPVLEGGWGADWDLWPAALSHWTTRMRNAFERIRSIEALMVLAGMASGRSWQEDRARLEDALTDYFKYFEHGWTGTSESLKEKLLRQKKQWTSSFEAVIAAADENATAAASRAFKTDDDGRVVVFNSLGFVRTDYADLPVSDGEAFKVIDVVTGEEVPSQTVTMAEGSKLRFLAEGVPALGYRQYRLEPGASSRAAPAAIIDGGSIESDWYRIETGRSGEITSAIDKRAGRPMSANSLNFVAEGTVTRSVAENVGPVSATLRLDIEGEPDRIVRLTLFREIDRLEIENVALGRPEAELSYVFDFGLENPEIRFEELGAIARPGLVAEGGNFLPGTNAEFMTLNHFANIEGDDDYNVTLSNWDAFAMRIGNSTPKQFDLPSSRIAVLGVGNPRNPGFEGQGGAEHFVNRFALTGHQGGFSGARAMQASLAHQNPLRVIAVPPNQSGPLSEPASSLAAVNASNVVVVALKPAEEPDGGYVLRLWELDGRDTSFEIDVSAFQATQAFETSLIETVREPMTLDEGKIAATIGANEIKTFRFVHAAERADNAY